MSGTTKVMYVARAQGQRLAAQTAPLSASLQPKQVLIRLKAVAINPADIKMIDQGHRVSEWPIVPGLDGSGIVEAVGSEVSCVKKGDEVLAQFTPGPVTQGGGSFQTLAAVQEMMVAKKPNSLSWEDAASIPVCFFTAMVGLGAGLSLPLPFLKDGPTADRLKSGSILVLGGSSALGASAIQLLRLALPDAVILTTVSAKHQKLVPKLGAHEALDRSSSSLISNIKAATPNGKGVDAIFDAVGAGASDRSVFDALNASGPMRYAQVWTGDDEIEVPIGVDSVLFRSRDFMQISGGENFFLALETLLAAGKYKAPLPIRKAGDGLKSLESGLDAMRRGVSGEKLVVTV